MLKTIRVAGILAMSLMSLAGPAATHAAAADTGGLSDAIVLQGHASVSPPVLLTPNTGTFTVDSISRCTLVSDPGEGGTTEPTTCTVSVTGGTYNNIVCGTGTASGTVTITESDGGTISGTFTITFVGGQGTITGNISESDSAGPFVFSGTASIVPDTPPPPAPACANGFTFTVAATLTEVNG
jgi:hypothetical protein